MIHDDTADDMSYAEAAAPHQGQAQTDDETENYAIRRHPSEAFLTPRHRRVPDPVPEIMHDDSGVHSVESLQSVNEHILSLPSDPSYAAQQDRAQHPPRDTAEDIIREAKEFNDRAEARAQQLGSDAESASKDAAQNAERGYEGVKSKFKEDAHEAKKYANAAGAKIEEGAKDAKKHASAAANKAEKEGKKAEDWAEKNKSNPVVVGNAVVIAALGALLGTGAYRAHQSNTLTWNVMGAWAGAVGLFAVGDYFVSQYFFKKYPPKN